MPHMKSRTKHNEVLCVLPPSNNNYDMYVYVFSYLFCLWISSVRKLPHIVGGGVNNYMRYMSIYSSGGNIAWYSGVINLLLFLISNIVIYRQCDGISISLRCAGSTSMRNRGTQRIRATSSRACISLNLNFLTICAVAGIRTPRILSARNQVPLVLYNHWLWGHFWLWSCPVFLCIEVVLTSPFMGR